MSTGGVAVEILLLVVGCVGKLPYRSESIRLDVAVRLGAMSGEMRRRE